MQDAFIGSWAQESHLSAEHAELVARSESSIPGFGRGSGRRLGGRGSGCGEAGSGQVAPLSAAQRAAAANCPYALFDLRFQDDGYWRARLQNAGDLARRRRADGRRRHGRASCGSRSSTPGTSPRAPGSRRSCCSA